MENLSKSGQQQELNVKIHDGIYSTTASKYQKIYLPTEIQYQVRILKFWPRNPVATALGAINSVPAQFLPEDSAKFAILQTWYNTEKKLIQQVILWVCVWPFWKISIYIRLVCSFLLIGYAPFFFKMQLFKTLKWSHKSLSLKYIWDTYGSSSSVATVFTVGGTKRGFHFLSLAFCNCTRKRKHAHPP